MEKKKRKNNDLEALRKKIASIDYDIANLFEKRMRVVKEVARFKKEKGLAIFDKEQEKKVIDGNLSYIKNDNMKEYFNIVLKDLLKVSKKYQRESNE